MELEIRIADVDYRTDDEEVTVRCFGKTPEGENVLLLDHDFLPYLYAVPVKGADIDKLEEKIREKDFEEEGEPLPVEKVEKKEMLDLDEEKQVLKVYSTIPAKIPKLKNKLWDLERVSECREFDIPFYRRYLIDKGIRPGTLLTVRGEDVSNEEFDHALELNEIVDVPEKQVESDSPSETGEPGGFNWKTFAFDLEVYKDEIIMASIYGEDFTKLLTTEDIEREFVEVVDSEKQLIERFVEIIRDEDVDILTGYNTDEFDFDVMRERSNEHNIELSLGRDGERMKFNRRGRFKGARLKGRMHLDLYPFVEHIMSQGLDSETLDLDSVAEELLGENKEDMSWERMKESWKQKKDLEEFADYALKDSELAFKLAKELAPQVLELSRIVGLIPFDACRLTYGQLTENYLLREAHERSMLARNRPSQDARSKRRRQGTYSGGFVYTPEAGLYKDIALFDFKSLYPTVMVAHNISPDSLNLEDCENILELDEFEHEFCQDKQGFFPELVEGLVKDRSEIKQKMAETDDEQKLQELDNRQQAEKILANSFYGYLGYNGARWYSRESAEATTYLGRKHIQETIELAKDEGFEVVYGDSLDHSRQIVVRSSEGELKFMRIGRFVEDIENPTDYETLAFDIENESAVFKPVKKAVKHDYDGEMVRFDTSRGRTKVTPQHSVYKFEDGNIQLADADKLQEGDKLVSLSDTPAQEKVAFHKGDILDLTELELSSDMRAYIDKKRFPAERGKCPYCEEEYFLSSHVHAKHSDRKVELGKVKDKHKFIGAKNAKAGRIPRYWELSEEFAWVLGYFCGDGSVSYGKKQMISFGGQKRELIDKTKSFFDEKLEDNLKIIEDLDERTGNKMYYYRVQGEPIAEFFVEGLGIGKGSETKRVPSIIINADRELKSAFIEGYTDADGSVESDVDERYNSESVRYSSKSSFLSNQVQYILKQIENGENRYGRKINDVSYKYREDKPKIKSIRTTATQKPVYNGWSFTPAEINNKVKVEPEKDRVYDIEVEGHHNFVDAEGLMLVHNTDSVFLRGENIRQRMDGFLDDVNERLPRFMQLEFEGFFTRGFFTSTDSGEGAKKKYALLSEDGSMKITGFEQVRRDWSPIAKKTQKEVLRKVLEDEVDEAAELVKDTVTKLQEGEIDVEDLRIYTQLTKKPEEYDSTAPHVEAAKKAMKRGEEISPEDTISYVITRGGGNISSRAELPKYADSYDSSYYIDNQLIPVAMRVLKVFGYTADQLKGEGKQSGLGRFG